MEPIFLAKILLSESGAPLVRAQLLRQGRYSHPAIKDGDLVINEALLHEVKRNFDLGLRGKELPGNINHDDPTFKISKGWIQKMEVAEDENGELGLFGDIEPTPAIAKNIKDKEIKYVSPELEFNKTHPETKQKIAVAMRGFAWTNIPYVKKLKAAQVLNFAEVDPADLDGDDDPITGGDSDRPATGTAHAKDPDAKEDDLPEQCRSCDLLQSGDCPFKGIEVKMAAASEGTCPRYEAADNSREYPKNQGNQNEVSMTEEQIQELKDQAAKATALESQVALLAENDRRREAELSELRTHTAARDIQVFLSEAHRSGRLVPAEIPLAERLLRRAAGQTGVVTLSELSEGADVDLGETTLNEDIRAFISALEPRVNLSEDTVDVRKPKIDSTIDLSELASKRAKEDNIGYGEALRLVSAELSKKGVGFEKPPKEAS